MTANLQHPTVALTVGDGLVIDVDEELAAIVDLLWTGEVARLRRSD